MRRLCSRGPSGHRGLVAFPSFAAGTAGGEVTKKKMTGKVADALIKQSIEEIQQKLGVQLTNNPEMRVHRQNFCLFRGEAEKLLKEVLDIAGALVRAPCWGLGLRMQVRVLPGTLTPTQIAHGQAEGVRDQLHAEPRAAREGRPRAGSAFRKASGQCGSVDT